MLERSLVALGRHTVAFDAFYVFYALLAVAIGVGLSLVTGLWALLGLTLACFGLVAVLARKRYEQSEGD
jgi:membrane protein implicated in regulation of membrane protease activity